MSIGVAPTRRPRRVRACGRRRTQGAEGDPDGAHFRSLRGRPFQARHSVEQAANLPEGPRHPRRLLFRDERREERTVGAPRIQDVREDEARIGKHAPRPREGALLRGAALVPAQVVSRRIAPRRIPLRLEREPAEEPRRERQRTRAVDALEEARRPRAHLGEAVFAVTIHARARSPQPTKDQESSSVSDGTHASEGATSSDVRATSGIAPARRPAIAPARRGRCARARTDHDRDEARLGARARGSRARARALRLVRARPSARHTPRDVRQPRPRAPPRRVSRRRAPPRRTSAGSPRSR